MAKKKSVFTCQECGYQSPKYLGRCPNCSAWSSFVEEVEVQEVKNARVSLNGEKSRPTKLKDVSSINYSRTKTDMDEFNRVLGGGVVPGSLVLIGGDPGIGKSTLLLQVSTQLANKGTVLYVSGEESAEQIKLRSERLGDIDNEFYLYAETNMQSIRSEIEKIKPDFLIIDSIQTIMSPEVSSVQGSVSQVREVTAELMQLAKTNNIATFIVGHVTKEGTLAGPRMLEQGGVKLDEPAIDLAVAVAIASSYKEKPTNPQESFIGEIGLTGEIRRVTRIEQRINEASKLGFTKIYAPKNSLAGIEIPKGIDVIGVTTVSQVLKAVFST